jgi:uncharacterized protein
VTTPRSALLVFLKAPRPGAVKTRLAAAVGPALAAAVYRALAEQVVRATAPAGEYERVFLFDPPQAAGEIRAWLGDHRLHPQAAGDLGRRMAEAFAYAFALGAGRAAVVGTDAPGLSRALVCAALQGLADHDLVLGPALDGGYYLIALDRPRPELFEGIPWSTPRVLERTLERASELGLRVRLLEPQPDVDTLDDLRREWDRLAPVLGDALAAYLRQAYWK